MQKNAGISKIKGTYALKGIFYKLHMSLYLRAKFEVSSIILTGFRQGGGVIPGLGLKQAIPFVINE